MNKMDLRRAPRVQFISRDASIPGMHGSGDYVIGLLRYLREAGIEIEYDLLRPVGNAALPLYVIPRAVAKLARVIASNGRRLGRVSLDTQLAWPFLLGWLFYYYLLPESIKRVYRAARVRWGRLPRRGISGTGLRSSAWDALPTPGEFVFVRGRYESFAPHVVIVDYAWLAPILEALPAASRSLKVILTHDILHQRVADFARLGLDSLSLDWTRDTEGMVLRKAQVLLAIQEEDAGVLKAMAPDSEVLCVPVAARLRTTPFKQVRGRCLFVGSQTDHNVVGLQWFLENVWPTILQSVPHSTLHVCGTVCRVVTGTFPKVRLMGRVKDLDPEYGAAEVCLVPLPVGSGLKIKLVEALSYGRAIVSTTVGLQGVHYLKGAAVLAADSAQDFAAAAVSVLTDSGRRKNLEENARAYSLAKFSPEVTYQTLVDRVRAHVRRDLARTPSAFPHTAEMAGRGDL